ncbi:hypothetical protein [Sphingomonas sp. BK580]|uniref:hypothetical protein n=1 Tax=Sphingomonas sp. BK580 TaxID=2586972 RepID=UPI0016205750|nr:hypothetical protein [Sphingomonas sp. BK580]MBB3694913.1 hypothetical protein [Sphingomonas sp. BK580]
MTILLALLIAAAASPSDRTVFACRMGDRTAAVVRIGSNLIYRSVRRGRVELEVPHGRYAQEGFSGGGELQAAFRNGPWTYVVYERTVRTSFHGTNDPSFEAGVDVLRGGRVVARQRCTDGSSQFTGQLAGIPEGGFIEH